VCRYIDICYVVPLLSLHFSLVKEFYSLPWSVLKSTVLLISTKKDGSGRGIWTCLLCSLQFLQHHFSGTALLNSPPFPSLLFSFSMCVYVVSDIFSLSLSLSYDLASSITEEFASWWYVFRAELVMTASCSIIS
jgi:hypothetical protein